MSLLSSGFTAPTVTRYAPSPTGFLHLGHVVNAVYVWGMAGALGGSVVVRIEDHDRVRSRAEYEAAILDDLRWLGFLRPRADRRDQAAISRQSDRHAIYEHALQRLRSGYKVFACDCSRSEIGGERYPGRCRDRGLPERPGHGLRVQVEPGLERFDDRLLGPLEQSPADQCGDLLIRDRDGNWTYQFAVTVDDLCEGITLVVRGADLLSSTGRQIRLARMLTGVGVPEQPRTLPFGYLHHPLLFGDDGTKLSKSDGAAGVRNLRQRLTPAEVIGMAAAAVGLVPAHTLVTADDVPILFR
jgi:glutamyl-Q tRNA(Asp) synthetase